MLIPKLENTPSVCNNIRMFGSENGQNINRRQFLKLAGATVASTSLPSLEAHAENKYLKEIIEQLQPNREAIVDLTNKIARDKWNDQTLRKRMLQPLDELDGQTIPEYATIYGMEPFFEATKTKNKTVSEMNMLYVTGRQLPGILIQESTLNPNAKSADGAVGLGQITDIAYKDTMRHAPVVSTFFAKATNRDPRFFVKPSMELARTHLQQNMAKYIEKDVNALADKFNLGDGVKGSLWGLLAVNAYNAGPTPIRAIIRAYTKRGTLPNSDPAATEIMADMAKFGYQNRQNIEGAQIYGEDAATYVFLVLGSTKASDKARSLLREV